MVFFKRGLPSAVVIGLLTLLLVLSIAIPMGSKANASNGVSDLSLYQRASELTREFATAIAPGSGVENMWMIQTNDGSGRAVAGNAGAFLGYAEVLADDKGIVGWLMNSYTTASATITYDQLENVVGGSSEKNPFYQYAGYGEVLTEMGLISTLRPGLSETGRMIATGAVLIVYLLANVAPFLFKGALMILITLNPFRLFETIFTGTANADLGIISGIAEYVSDLYMVVQDFSIVILMPLLLATTVFSMLVIKKGSALKYLARYGLRIFMLFAGLPLIGATYTGIIEDLDAQVSVGSEYADYLVLSSYVDFESWVKYSRLAPPKDSNIKNPRLDAENEDLTLSDRKLILSINGERAANTRAYALKDRYSSTSDIGEIFEKGGTKTVVTGSNHTTVEEEKSFGKVFSILSRHMSGAKYTSSDYDGEVSGQIQKMRSGSNSEEQEKAIVKMFSLTSSDNRTWSQKWFGDNEDWMKAIYWNGEDNEESSSAKGLFTEGQAANDLYRFGPYRMNIYNTGDLRYDNYYVSPNMPDVVSSKTAPIGTDRAGTVGGLSPIAMYNFLNTTFSNTGLTVYSPNKTTTDLSRDSYAAVTFGGSGVASVTRWIENFVVMLSLASLSIAFGVMMIVLSIKNIPRILSGVFGTAFGSIAFATKLLISTAVLIIQVIGMIFLYTLSENIIMTILLHFNDLMSVGGEYFNSGVVFEFLSSFLVTTVTAVVTIFMIKNMKVFREMMEEVVSNAINRVMGTLDTSTGGRGLDAAQTTGGRIGADGKLTDGAKADDKGGLLGGAAGILAAAHDLESKRENLAGERGMEGRSMREKLAARLGTAKDLASAKGRDTAKDALGIDGQSLAREMEAKNASIQAMTYGDATALGKVTSDEFTKNDDPVISTTSHGQQVDDNGDIVQDAQGNAIDRDGKPISPAVPVGASGMKAAVASDGSLLDSDGNTYTDEMGNAFYQNEQGQLVDAKGVLMDVDKDGTIQPIAAIPGHSGKAVSAKAAAKRLDDMRFNANKYEAMKQEQNASHYGMDAKGNVVDAKGNALQIKGANGPVAAQLDGDGFITDKQGNRVPASGVMGAVDPRGFETVTDPNTGVAYVQHKGDKAMKNVGNTSVKSGSQNLTTMARQANQATAVADRANKRVEQLKASGAPPYAVMQAQRFANQASKNATVAQNSFNQAMTASATATQTTATTYAQPVTTEQVASAKQFAKSQQIALQSEVAKLNQMKTNSASKKDIARQEGKVDAQLVATQQAFAMAQSTNIAKTAGRSFNEVHKATDRVARAETLFQNAQHAYTQAVVNKQPKEKIAKLEAKMNKASNGLSMARDNMNRLSQKPAGTPEQIDKATAVHEQAKASHQQAMRRVQELQQNGGSPQEIKEAKQQQARASKRLTKSRIQKEALLNPAGWNASESTPQIQRVPSTPQSKSYATLASSGITTYSDYSNRVTKETSKLKENESKLKQAQSRLSTLRSSNRPPQQIEQAQAEVNVLKATVRTSQAQLKELQDNAHGLLKNGMFQPVVANRPIRKNGTEIINQLVNMGHTQSLYDKLAYQEKSGTITQAGRKQMKQLSGQLNYIRKNLVSSGIREDAIRDSVSIEASTRHMQQSWESFVNGKSVELGE